ncbi:hypothetical protein EI555_009604, partial [Monodon monoceros]
WVSRAPRLPGCRWRAPGATPGAVAPGARAARGQGGGSWCLRGRVERRCQQGGRLPMDELALGPQWGRPAAAATFPPQEDATAATVVPFQRMLSPRRAPEVFYGLSDRGAHRGYPIPTPRVCVGLFGALGGNQPSCRAQPLSGRAGARRLSSV